MLAYLFSVHQNEKVINKNARKGKKQNKSDRRTNKICKKDE